MLFFIFLSLISAIKAITTRVPKIETSSFNYDKYFETLQITHPVTAVWMRIISTLAGICFAMNVHICVYGFSIYMPILFRGLITSVLSIIIVYLVYRLGKTLNLAISRKLAYFFLAKMKLKSKTLKDLFLEFINEK